MKKVTKENFIKKINKLYQLKKESEILKSNIDNINSELSNEDKTFKDYETEYNQLISSSSPVEVKAYPADKFDTLMSNLKSYSKKIKNLNAIKRKTIKKWHKVEDKIKKLSKTR